MAKKRSEATESDMASELALARAEAASLRRRVDHLLRIEQLHLETLANLEIHQEELRVQNEELRRTQERLSYSSRKYHALFNNAPMAYFLLDRDMVVADLNYAGASLLGVDIGRILGKSFSIFLDASGKETLRRHFALVLEGQRNSCELSLVRKNGGQLPVLLESAPLEAWADEGWRCLISAVDLSLVKDAEALVRESEARFRALFEQSPLSTQITKPNGRVVGVNSSCERLWGASASGMIGRNLLEDPAFIAAGGENLMRRVFSQGAVEMPDMLYDVGGGGARWMRGIAYPIRGLDDGVREIILMHEDVTDRREAELKLQSALEDLARSNAELQQFAYVASHDLQEPLRTIITYLQLLERRHGESLVGDAREYLDFAVGAARRLRALVGDLLAYSRVDSATTPFVETPAGKILDTAVNDMKGMIDEAGASVVRDELPVVVGDAPQLGRLFANLLSNAIKYRAPDREPRVVVSAEDNGEYWIFSVSDNGIGIEPEYFSRIFMIFQRLHSQKEFDGTGIGLATCKKIVERHGGAIWVESRLGEGSNFRFSLPKKPANLVRKAPSGPTPPPAAPVPGPGRTTRG